MTKKRLKVLRRWVDNRMAHGDTLEDIASYIALHNGIPAEHTVTRQPDTYVVLEFDYEEQSKEK